MSTLRQHIDRRSIFIVMLVTLLCTTAFLAYALWPKVVVAWNVLTNI